MTQGLFITFEGGEGSGKSTQIERLATVLHSAEYGVLEIREPGSNQVSESIRDILLHPGNEELNSRTELLLYEAARAQLTAEVIRPALEKGTVVLCDRFFDSTTAYQGYGRGFDISDIEHLNLLATGSLVPTRTLVLDVDPEQGLRRATATAHPDRLERESLVFHRKVREGFRALAAANPQRVRLIDSSQSKDVVTVAVFAALADLLPVLAETRV